MRLALASVLAALVVAAPAAAAPVTETAQLGSVRAELSYDTREDQAPENLHLRVFDGDTQLVDQAIPNDQFMSPARYFVDKKSVRVVDLDGDGVGEAMFDLFTGGAHCCLDTRVYQGSTLIRLFTGNVGYRLKDYDGDGVPEIDSLDDNFSGAYSSYAASMQPIQVLRFREGAFVNFTTDESVAPTLRKQIKRFTELMRRYRKWARKDPELLEVVRSTLAGIAADRCSLGDCAKGYALIDKAVARGDVTRKFRRQVQKDLTKLGYDT